MSTSKDSRRRVVIESVKPEVDGGRFPIKRIVGDNIVVEADIFADGDEVLSCVLLYRKEGDLKWQEIPMEPLGNDRWRAMFVVSEIGRYLYSLRAWIERFNSWRRDLAKKIEAGQAGQVDLLIGAELVEKASRRADGSDATKLREWARALRAGQDFASNFSLALSEELASLVNRYADTQFGTTYKHELGVVVDREKARFGAWYEMFPRSCAVEARKHGTFKDCEARLAYVSSMGFDVLYLPPIHPIGRTHRKGKNNSVVAGPDDPGSPWAIGSEEGGHKAIHSELGTLEDFKRLMAKAHELGIEIALDVAFQCSPDHPYVKAHPQWFRWRPDGTIQYAENPPKKYQDIYPLDFDTDQWEELWQELKSVFLYWIDQGVRLFRVDNPHTKPFSFWEWLIAEVKKDYPDVIFLSEAFTRPKIMYRLAKLGFTQSYNYFAWRNTKTELAQYFTELTQTEVREFFRPNLWPNTPDILTEYHESGGRPAFMVRLILAATLGANYGIYGPAFELGEHRRKEPETEEYFESEKYEIKHWDIERPDSLRALIATVNRIRRQHPALQSDWNLRFHPTDNDQILCYSKQAEDDLLVTVVNLDPHHSQSGSVDLALDQLHLDARGPYEVHDLLTDRKYLWRGSKNYVELNPQMVPAHVFQVWSGAAKNGDSTSFHD